MQSCLLNIVDGLTELRNDDLFPFLNDVCARVQNDGSNPESSGRRRPTAVITSLACASSSTSIRIASLPAASRAAANNKTSICIVKLRVTGLLGDVRWDSTTWRMLPACDDIRRVEFGKLETCPTS